MLMNMDKLQTATAKLRALLIKSGLTKDPYSLPTLSNPNEPTVRSCSRTASLPDFKTFSPSSPLPSLTKIHSTLTYPLKLPKLILLTYLLTLLSSYFLTTGLLFTRDYTYCINLSCTPDYCVYTTYEHVGYDYIFYPIWEERKVELERDSFDRVLNVRVRSGEIASVQGLKRRQLRKLGYSYAIVFNNKHGENENLLLSHANVGKRSARERVANLNQRMRMKGDLRNEEGRAWCVKGLLKICAGVLMMAVVSLVGEWSLEGWRYRYGDAEGKKA